MVAVVVGRTVAESEIVVDAFVDCGMVDSTDDENRTYYCTVVVGIVVGVDICYYHIGSRYGRKVVEVDFVVEPDSVVVGPNCFVVGPIFVVVGSSFVVVEPNCFVVVSGFVVVVVVVFVVVVGRYYWFLSFVVVVVG